jgi:hypothetical protein
VSRSRGVITSLVINPKRKGISTVSIEDIKAKKATLAAPLDLHGRVLITGSLDEEVCSLLNDQVTIQHTSLLKHTIYHFNRRMDNSGTLASSMCGK